MICEWMNIASQSKKKKKKMMLEKTSKTEEGIVMSLKQLTDKSKYE